MLSGPITLLAESAAAAGEPAVKKVYDDFKALNPGVEWDIRSIPGLGPEWDRLARAALESGEPVDVICSMACSFERGRGTGCWRTSGAIQGWRTSSPASPTGSTSEGLERPPRAPSRSP